MSIILRTILAAVLLGLGSAAHAFAGLNAINIAVKWDGIKAAAASQINDQLTGEEFADGAPSVSLPSSRFAYRYSPQRTQENLRNFIARTPVEAGRAELERQLAAQPGLMDEISAGARSFGFDPHNVADAYAMWWMNAWLVANKRDEVPDSRTVEAFKRQVRNAFAATLDFAKTSDAERQEYAEALLLQATMLGSAFEQWKNDPKMLDQLANAAHQGAKASGIDLSRMSLTQSGFVPREAK